MAREVKFRLTNKDPNITTLATFSTGWDDSWKYRVPQHTMILLRPGDLFSAYCTDSADVEYVAPDALVKIEVRDPSASIVRLVYGPANYLSSTEFQNVTSKRKLQIEEEIKVLPTQWIVIATKDSLGMDTASIAADYFELLTTKIIE